MSNATRYLNLIGGQWIAGDHDEPNINPSDTSDVIGVASWASAAQVQQAVSAARAAFSAWSLSTPLQRADSLERISRELLARKEELGRMLAREEGKTLPEGIGEVTRAAQLFGFFAGECVRLSGDVLASVRPGISVEVTREPVGVVALITPWNFPVAIPAWKIAPALAYGNCVVFKPAELVPALAHALADIIARSGIPDGVFNMVLGSGATVGSTLVNHPGVDAISFTGSQVVGKQIAATAAARMAKVQLEMGGKNPLVVLDDANLETAVNVATQGAFYSTGQRCTASSRIIVTNGIHDRFIARMREKLASLKVAHALEAGTDIGPVVDARQLSKDLEYIEIGKREGSPLIGGERVRGNTEGFFLAPALFIDTAPEMTLNREEVFGPVATVQRADSYEQALQLANATPFGLSAGIITTSLKYASHFKRHSQAGMVMVNVPTAGVDFHVPFGGRKESSYGPREQGRYAAEFYTTVKTAYTLPE